MTGQTRTTAPHFLKTRLSLRHLRIMLAIEKARTITSAAHLLGVSQVAVSKTLSELEAGLGGQLFERRRGGLVPSELCLRMLDTSRRIDRELNCLSEEFLMASGGFKGRVRIGLQTQSAAPFLSRAVVKFKQAYPLVTLSLSVGTSDEFTAALARGSVDFVIGTLAMSDPNTAFTSEPIRTEEALVVRGQSGKSDDIKQPITWKRLVDHTWCLPPSGKLLRVHFEHILANEGLPLPSSLIEMPPTFVAEAIVSGSGFFALVPSSVGMQWIKRGDIQLVNIDVPPLSDSMRLFWSEQGSMTPAARMFLEFIRDEIMSEHEAN